MRKVSCIGQAIKCFGTGDRPLLLLCSDQNLYLCKYNRFGGPSYALAREYIGTRLAQEWGLLDVEQLLVDVREEHLPESLKKYGISDCLGRQWKENVADINDASLSLIPRTQDNLHRLMQIALFDIWIANEDRTANNLNLLYDFQNGVILPIDHAGAFNTSFNPCLSLIDRYESLVYSSLFEDMYKECGSSVSIDEVYEYFHDSVRRCLVHADSIYMEIPSSWFIKESDVRPIMSFLTSDEWVSGTWKCFKEMIEILN